jgi:hypothetical protein
VLPVNHLLLTAMNGLGTLPFHVLRLKASVPRTSVPLYQVFHGHVNSVYMEQGLFCITVFIQRLFKECSTCTQDPAKR